MGFKKSATQLTVSDDALAKGRWADLYTLHADNERISRVRVDENDPDLVYVSDVFLYSSDFMADEDTPCLLCNEPLCERASYTFAVAGPLYGATLGSYAERPIHLRTDRTRDVRREDFYETFTKNRIGVSHVGCIMEQLLSTLLDKDAVLTSVTLRERIPETFDLSQLPIAHLLELIAYRWDEFIVYMRTAHYSDSEFLDDVAPGVVAVLKRIHEQCATHEMRDTSDNVAQLDNDWQQAVDVRMPALTFVVNTSDTDDAFVRNRLASVPLAIWERLIYTRKHEISDECIPLFAKYMQASNFLQITRAVSIRSSYLFSMSVANVLKYRLLLEGDLSVSRYIDALYQSHLVKDDDDALVYMFNLFPPWQQYPRTFRALLQNCSSLDAPANLADFTSAPITYLSAHINNAQHTLRERNEWFALLVHRYAEEVRAHTSRREVDATTRRYYNALIKFRLLDSSIYIENTMSFDEVPAYFSEQELFELDELYYRVLRIANDEEIALLLEDSAYYESVYAQTEIARIIEALVYNGTKYVYKHVLNAFDVYPHISMVSVMRETLAFIMTLTERTTNIYVYTQHIRILMSSIIYHRDILVVFDQLYELALDSAPQRIPRIGEAFLRNVLIEEVPREFLALLLATEFRKDIRDALRERLLVLDTSLASVAMTGAEDDDVYEELSPTFPLLKSAFVTLIKRIDALHVARANTTSRLDDQDTSALTTLKRKLDSELSASDSKLLAKDAFMYAVFDTDASASIKDITALLLLFFDNEKWFGHMYASNTYMRAMENCMNIKRTNTFRVLVNRASHLYARNTYDMRVFDIQWNSADYKNVLDKDVRYARSYSQTSRHKYTLGGSSATVYSSLEPMQRELYNIMLLIDRIDNDESIDEWDDNLERLNTVLTSVYLWVYENNEDSENIVSAYVRSVHYTLERLENLGKVRTFALLVRRIYKQLEWYTQQGFALDAQYLFSRLVFLDTIDVERCRRLISAVYFDDDSTTVSDTITRTADDTYKLGRFDMTSMLFVYRFGPLAFTKQMESALDFKRSVQYSENFAFYAYDIVMDRADAQHRTRINMDSALYYFNAETTRIHSNDIGRYWLPIISEPRFLNSLTNGTELLIAPRHHVTTIILLLRKILYTIISLDASALGLVSLRRVYMHIKENTNDDHDWLARTLLDVNQYYLRELLSVNVSLEYLRNTHQLYLWFSEAENIIALLRYMTLSYDSARISELHVELVLEVLSEEMLEYELDSENDVAELVYTLVKTYTNKSRALSIQAQVYLFGSYSLNYSAGRAMRGVCDKLLADNSWLDSMTDNSVEKTIDIDTIHYALSTSATHALDRLLTSIAFDMNNALDKLLDFIIVELRTQTSRRSSQTSLYTLLMHRSAGYSVEPSRARTRARIVTIMDSEEGARALLEQWRTMRDTPVADTDTPKKRQKLSEHFFQILCENQRLTFDKHFSQFFTPRIQ